MGLRDLKKRLTTSVAELHDERLHDRFSSLGVTPIGEILPRTAVHIGGEITRMRVAPRSGVPAFEITIADGTGSAVAVFTGRRHLAGVDHHRQLILDGVVRTERGRLVMLNPAYTLLPR